MNWHGSMLSSSYVCFMASQSRKVQVNHLFSNVTVSRGSYIYEEWMGAPLRCPVRCR